MKNNLPFVRQNSLSLTLTYIEVWELRKYLVRRTTYMRKNIVRLTVWLALQAAASVVDI